MCIGLLIKMDDLRDNQRWKASLSPPADRLRESPKMTSVVFGSSCSLFFWSAWCKMTYVMLNKHSVWAQLLNDINHPKWQRSSRRYFVLCAQREEVVTHRPSFICTLLFTWFSCFFFFWTRAFRKVWPFKNVFGLFFFFANTANRSFSWWRQFTCYTVLVLLVTFIKRCHVFFCRLQLLAIMLINRRYRRSIYQHLLLVKMHHNLFKISTWPEHVFCHYSYLI